MQNLQKTLDYSMNQISEHQTLAKGIMMTYVMITLVAVPLLLVVSFVASFFDAEDHESQ